MNDKDVLYLNCRGNKLELTSAPLVMGILNVTPDSFSDGGLYYRPEDAVERALQMIEDGAGIIDIGGESTRPGAAAVPPREQIRRVIPVIESLSRQSNIPISIDTTSSLVARAALDAGADIINDISALRHNPDMAHLAARENAPVILMHMQGEPGTMQLNPVYDNVVEEVKQFLARRIESAVSAGINRDQIVIDPGIGFGKTVEHNLQLLNHLDEFHELAAAVLVGTSRKSFIGKVLDINTPDRRIFGTAASVALAVSKGVHIVRVHDVREMSQVVRLSCAILNA